MPDPITPAERAMIAAYTGPITRFAPRAPHEPAWQWDGQTLAPTHPGGRERAIAEAKRRWYGSIKGNRARMAQRNAEMKRRREEVARYVDLGLTTAEIASRLNVSTKTIRQDLRAMRAE
jgi:DNA-binding CsgD family transcriptional regulator